MPELLATARLQLHGDFDFDAATAVVPYHAALGISHLYLSPVAAAVPGSMHGYDVIDPTRVNPELGGEQGLRRLVAALRSHGMGVIVDIVPNHMAASVENPWWRDVLANGQASRYARYFDIDWAAPGTVGKVWLSILGETLADSVRRGRVRLDAGGDTGEPSLVCDETLLPLSACGMAYVLEAAGLAATQPESRATWLSIWDRADRSTIDTLVMAINNSPARLLDLVARQHYRPACWRSGNDAINYRRFFDISSLAALAIEHDDVFAAVHALPLRLIGEGLIDGLRIDHVDGLGAPGAYLKKLRHAVDAARSQRPIHASNMVTLHVEKILGCGEQLPADWPVEGTTGYEFMDSASAVMHDPDGEQPLRRAWSSISGRTGDFSQEARQARRELLGRQLYAEFQATLRAWWAVAENHGTDNDLTRHALELALSALLEHMPVYRTYLEDISCRDADREVLGRAFDAAANDLADTAGLEQLRRWLPGSSSDAIDSLQSLAQRRLEQTAAPLNAKSVEDTAFYRHGVLLSRNEVGSDPAVFSQSVGDFHRAMQWRVRQWPRALSATATHDHKRGEDTRARITVLSGRAAWFIDHATRWIAQWNDRQVAGASAITAGDAWMLLQTLFGAWPLGLDHNDLAGMHRFHDRLDAWQLKALREAKLQTSWSASNEAYEKACSAPLHAWLLDDAFADTRTELAAAARQLDVPGAVLGLSVVVLRLMAPGVPDLYQGTEFWDQSLVDPDNRRPVDYGARQQALTTPGAPADLLRTFRDGRIKQWIIARLLALRRQHAALFIEGDYRPLTVSGTFADRIVAFARRREGECCVIVVPRGCSDWLIDQPMPMVPAGNWKDTTVHLGPDDAACTFADVFMPRKPFCGAAWPVRQLLDGWPVAVLAS